MLRGVIVSTGFVIMLQTILKENMSITDLSLTLGVSRGAIYKILAENWGSERLRKKIVSYYFENIF